MVCVGSKPRNKIGDYIENKSIIADRRNATFLNETIYTFYIPNIFGVIYFLFGFYNLPDLYKYCNECLALGRTSFYYLLWYYLFIIIRINNSQTTSIRLDGVPVASLSCYVTHEIINLVVSVRLSFIGSGLHYVPWLSYRKVVVGRRVLGWVVVMSQWNKPKSNHCYKCIFWNFKIYIFLRNVFMFLLVRFTKNKKLSNKMKSWLVEPYTLSINMITSTHTHVIWDGIIIKIVCNACKNNGLTLWVWF